MSTPPRRFTEFLSELKRRRVFRVAAVYAAMAFVVVQIVDIAFPALHLPAWTLTLVVALAIVGFPFALVLAWAYDMTPQGVVRTEPTAPAAPRGNVASNHVGTTPSLAVLPFVNMSADAENVDFPRFSGHGV